MTATPQHLAAVWTDIRRWLSPVDTGRLLGAHLAARYSPDGQFESVLAGEEALHLPRWLAGPRAEEVERSLLAALLCGFAAAESRSLSGAISTGEIDDLMSLLRNRSEVEMGRAIGGRPDYGPMAEDPIEVVLELGCVAGAILSRRTRNQPREMAQALSRALILERDVRDLVPSLRARRINRAARLLADHGGLDPDDEESIHLLLGMAGLGEGREAILEPWNAALDTAAELSAGFESAELERWIGALRARYDTLAATEGSLVAGAAQLAPLPLFGRSEVPPRSAVRWALEMAAGYLLADADLVESWEVHRRGFLGHELVTAPFPAGLVLEVLARSGLDVSDRIVRYLDRLAAQDFTYYDAPEFTWIETDTVGTVLRLLQNMENADRWESQVDALVARTMEAIESTTGVPVWLIDPARVVVDSGMVLLGEGCGAIQARLLAALLERDGAAVPRVIIEELLARFTVDGLAIGVNYPPLFTAGAVREVLSVAAGVVSDGVVESAADALRDELESWSKRDLTPQQAALLISACADSPDRDLVDRRFVEMMLDAQDPDGGWPAEPLFYVPNKGGSVTWHRSRLLTTALCFDALSRWSAG